ncbi:hypothetical protein CMV30_03490 [Nibricoccus aquaticus]|uniref:DUF3325 domain-containing protein n=1 Tax=Nibricoccus aquaticus TaxID=2576891 RepID=A0A290Q3K7_9BACT|nr:DUF3325 domain-containing protein [Nibricoccus aquaticus]ATC63094.1 hypothetical protein CMV30_03490 [Nibricoccus aquaticus]
MSADVVVVCAAFAAMAWLALGMGTHGRAALAGGRLANVPRAVWKGAGWLGVALTLAAALRGHGWGVGVVLWLLALGAAGFVVTLVVSYRARWLPVAGALAMVVAGVMALIAA